MPNKLRHVGGLLFAIAFASLAFAIRRPLIEYAPPRILDVFLIGVALAALLFSWLAAAVLFAASLVITHYTFPVPLWPLEPANVPDLLRLAVYSAVAFAIIAAAERLRARAAHWRDVAEELRRSRDSVRESEARTRAVVYSATDGIITADERGLIRSFNPAAERLFGYSADEVLGRDLSVLMPSPWREQHAGYIARYRETGVRGIIGAGSRDAVGVRKDGRTFPVELAVSEMALPEGRLFTGIVRDATQRKQAEEAIREANETLRAVIETAPLAIYVLGLDGTVKNWNAAAEKMFGWSEAEVRGKPLPFVREHQWPELVAALDAARRGEPYSGVERRRETRTGAAIDIAIWNAVLRNREGTITGVLSVVADVTDRRRLEQQLQQSAKMEAIGRLAGGVAHDFNNVLTIITGYAQMLADAAADDGPLKRDLDEILKAAEHAGALTNQLLVFSRQHPAKPQIIKLNAVVARLEKILRRMIGEDVELITAGAEPCAVRADPAHIEQVLLNLAVNARDAMPRGGRLTIETAAVDLDDAYARTHIGVTPGPYAMLAVSDTGIGMDAETRSRAFEPFFTTKDRGTGLGLSTVYGIVKQCKGEIWVYSEPGQGTTFKIYLPAAGETMAVGAASREPEPAGGAETVLLVEDEAGVRKLVRNVLAEQGYKVIEAADPHDALRLCAKLGEPIHLLLTDVVMPNMSGRDLADRALGLRPGLKILYMSGYTDNVVLDHGVTRTTQFLQKPFTPTMLIRKVRQLLDSTPESA